MKFTLFVANIVLPGFGTLFTKKIVQPGFPRWLLPLADDGSELGIRPQFRP